MDNAIERVLIDEASIATKVEAMAAEISTTYRGADELILVCILNGAFRFTADLEQHLTVPYNIDFMSLSSYPTAETKATGEVRVLLDVKNSLHSKHVLIVEDIIDSGHTLELPVSNAGDQASRLAALLRAGEQNGDARSGCESGLDRLPRPE